MYNFCFRYIDMQERGLAPLQRVLQNIIVAFWDISIKQGHDRVIGKLYNVLIFMVTLAGICVKNNKGDKMKPRGAPVEDTSTSDNETLALTRCDLLSQSGT